MKRILSGIVVAALSVTGVPVSAHADEPASGQEGTKCISLQRIQSTEVIDKQHILFRLTRHDMYVNTLSHPCPGLRPNQPYMYSTSMSQLCSLDSITVLNQVPFGFTAGASCGLGTFEPIDEEGVKELKAAAKANW